MLKKIENKQGKDNKVYNSLLKKLPGTPRSRVRSAIRQLWLRSRERAAALKAQGYCCQSCGAKQSKTKGKEVFVEVHHKTGIGNWEQVIDAIYEQILCSPELLEVLCPDCHKEIEQIRKGGE